MNPGFILNSSSAVIAYVPALARIRVPLALVLLLIVAGLTWFGHGGRAVFAAMTILFAVVASTLIVVGLVAPQGPAPHGQLVTRGPASSGLLAVLLAFPVAMALATGVEAPESAIAQLGQLNDDGRRRFGQVTLWPAGKVRDGLTKGAYRLAPEDMNLLRRLRIRGRGML